MNFIRKSKLLIVMLVVVVGLFGLGLLGKNHVYLSESFAGIQNKLAAVFFWPSVTVSDLQTRYHNGQKIRILIVPGHEPNFGGAEYRDLKERDMTLALADNVKTYF